MSLNRTAPAEVPTIKIVAWAEHATPGPMAEALGAQNVPYRLDQGHDGWMFSVRLRDWIFAKSIASEIGSDINGWECEAEADHFVG